MKHVIIVESPSKCKIVERIANSDQYLIQYECIATKGHLLQLKTPKKVTLQDVHGSSELPYSIIPKQKPTIRLLRTKINKCDKVILACDDDREGEFIAWQVCKLFDLPPTTTTRIRFQEITQNSIKYALNHTERINMNRVYSSMSRQWIDYCIGYMLSPFIWKYIGSYPYEGLSCGRCQTPALELLYQNEQICESNNKDENISYFIEGKFTDGIYAKIQLVKSLYNRTLLNQFLNYSKTYLHIITYKSTYSKTIQPPKPYTTSSLQQDMYIHYRFSPTYTMKLAQSLYEHGYITYMRTDSTRIAKDVKQTILDYIQIHYGELYCREICDLNKEKKTKNMQNAHECIRPTVIERRTYNIETQNEKDMNRMYYAIWKQTVQHLMIPAVHSVTPFTITSPLSVLKPDLENDLTVYKGNNTQIIEKGWSILNTKSGNSESETTQYTSDVNTNAQKDSTIELNCVSTKVTTKPSQRYGYNTWLKKIELSGFGRPSTYSSIMEKVLNRKYAYITNSSGEEVRIPSYKLDMISNTITEEPEYSIIVGNENNKLFITEIGYVVRMFLYKYFYEIFNIEYTQKLELILDDIEHGNIKWYQPCISLFDTLHNIIDNNNVSSIKRFSLCVKEPNLNLHFTRSGFIMKHNDEEFILNNKGKQMVFSLFKTGEWERFATAVSKSSERILGKINEQDVILKHGRYGYFVTLGKDKISIKTPIEDMESYSLDNVYELIGRREGNFKYMIGKGKYGPYLKTNNMNQTKYFSLKGCSLKYKINTYDNDISSAIIDWVKKKHSKKWNEYNA